MHRAVASNMQKLLNELDFLDSRKRQPTPMAKAEKLTVFYDGACPLCELEISFYRRRQGADEVSWVDVSGTSIDEVAPGLSRDKALARFHVMHPDGTLVSGGRAFADLWSILPGFRPWGRLLRYRPLTWVLNRVYNLFLGFRPRLQAMMAARQTHQTAPGRFEVLPLADHKNVGTESQ
jgi:predicted DCC family thiol-disulfide oxidoreductase YuxK